MNPSGDKLRIIKHTLSLRGMVFLIVVLPALATVAPVGAHRVQIVALEMNQF